MPCHCGVGAHWRSWAWAAHAPGVGRPRGADAHRRGRAGAALLLLAETRPALPAEESVTLEGTVVEAPAYQEEQERAVLVVQDAALGKVRLYLNAAEAAVAGVALRAMLCAQMRACGLIHPRISRSTYGGMGLRQARLPMKQHLSRGRVSFARVRDTVRDSIAVRIEALFPRTADLVTALSACDRSDWRMSKTTPMPARRGAFAGRTAARFLTQDFW